VPFTAKHPAVTFNPCANVDVEFESDSMAPAVDVIWNPDVVRPPVKVEVPAPPTSMVDDA